MELAVPPIDVVSKRKEHYVCCCHCEESDDVAIVVNWDDIFSGNNCAGKVGKFS